MKKENKQALKESKKKAEQQNETYSLNDDRRVRVLSPGAMVAKRFFRNRIAMVGLFVLIAMFIFCFLGGLLSPYGESELFYRNEIMQKAFASATENSELRYINANGQDLPTAARGPFYLATKNGSNSFDYNGVTYNILKESDDLYIIYLPEGTDVISTT